MQTFLKLGTRYLHISYFDTNKCASYSILSLHSTPGFHVQYVRDHVNRSSGNREVIPKCKGGSRRRALPALITRAVRISTRSEKRPAEIEVAKFAKVRKIAYRCNELQ